MIKLNHIFTFLFFHITSTASAQENRLYLINSNDSSNVVRVLFDQTFIVKLSDSLLHRGKIISCTDSSIVMTEFYSNDIHETFKISEIQSLMNPYIGNMDYFFILAVFDALGLVVSPIIYIIKGSEEGNKNLIIWSSIGAVVLTGRYLGNHGATYDLKNDWKLRCKNWNTNPMLLPLKQSEIR